MNQAIGPQTIEIDGQRYEITPEEWRQLDCIMTAPGEYHVLENGTSHAFTVFSFDLASRTCVIKVDGEIRQIRFLRDLDLLIEKMGLNVNPSKKLTHLDAPMPGLVTGINVKAGDEVEKGTPLLILEAMKMENVITSPERGVVKHIPVSMGQAVEKGTTLIEFD